MTKRKTPTSNEQLRRLAEERLNKSAAAERADAADIEVKRLVHELQVHQVELEMQNDELRRARHEVEAALARYTELFEQAPVGYATLDPEGIVRAVNITGMRLLEREHRLLIGKPFGDLLSIADQTAFKRLFSGTPDSSHPNTCEAALPRTGQAPRRLRLSVNAITDGPSGATVLLTFEDVTARVTREEKLVATERALRDAHRRKDEFLAMLSHELRNPLAPIRSSLSVLKRAEPDSGPAKNAQAIIERQVTHLTRLVDDLLDVTRVARGKVQLQLERVELGEFVRRSLEDHRLSFEQAGIRLSYRFDSGVFWVEADPARLVQALSDLLGNAEKFSERGGSVEVLVERSGNKVEIRVRDTGIGIAPDVLPHLFEPFAQAPQTMDRTRGGLGLGLAMVKGLIELHHGSVAIASDGPGRGTTVTLRLPLTTAPVQAKPDAEAPSPRSRRVLVIDDNQDAADSIRDALSLSGHHVESVYDGATGIERAREFRPEVVICDIGLPGMNGYDVVKAFRSDERLSDVYLVALTGYAMPDDVERAKQAGFNHYLPKPPSVESLDRLVGDAPVVAHR